MTQSLVDLTTQQWVKVTGRRINLNETPWLRGPVGDTDVIGHKFFQRHAARENLNIDAESPIRGLLPKIAALNGPHFSASQLHPQVARFYEETSTYSFDVSSEWKGGLRPFGGAVASWFGTLSGRPSNAVT